MPYLIIDLEMSGSEFGFHDIIQIGAVLADDKLNSLGEFSSLVYPKNDAVFSEEAEEIHAISIFDLEEAELITDAEAKDGGKCVCGDKLLQLVLDILYFRIICFNNISY